MHLLYISFQFQAGNPSSQQQNNQKTHPTSWCRAKNNRNGLNWSLLIWRNLTSQFTHAEILEIPLLYHVWEQIEQVGHVLSTESVQSRVDVMAAGFQNALHFHYDQSNVAHSKVHSGCTPFILNEELSAAVQWPLIWWCAAVIEAIRVKGLSLAHIDISPEWS